ncbi:FMN-binding protein [Lacrimispora sp.]|uniref:FMN-binding protein n=1 Tax=Lacrimispora sp. TaxID=2719234 RepID=UPI0028A8BA99|nr:FMN-binding protein [Lacrimispora sp.]
MKKMTLAIAAALCILALLAGCRGSADTYKAGTYTAAAEGYSGDVEVEVEFDQDSLLSVKVTDHNETVGIGDRAVEELPAKIVEELTWEVDAVASATMTSDAIKTAVKDCIEQARSK